MAHVEEARGVICDGELLDAVDVPRVFNGNGGMVGKNMKEGDGSSPTFQRAD